MNKLIFMNEFDAIDLEEINNLMRDRFSGHIPHDYFAEINEDTLTVVLNETDESVVITVKDYGLVIESDSFFMAYEVAQILADNYDENPDMRKYFTTPNDLFL